MADIERLKLALHEAAVFLHPDVGSVEYAQWECIEKKFYKRFVDRSGAHVGNIRKMNAAPIMEFLGIAMEFARREDTLEYLLSSCGYSYAHQQKMVDGIDDFLWYVKGGWRKC
jgi:hypothetical protein